MKKAIVILVFTLLVVYTAAFGAPPSQTPPNLVGSWLFEMQVVSATGNVGDNIGEYTTPSPASAEITSQNGNLFYGYSDHRFSDSYFYGAIVANHIYVTFMPSQAP